MVLLFRRYVFNLRKAETAKAELRLKNKRTLLEQSTRIQEDERRRIASELHDQLVSQLNYIRYHKDCPDNIAQRIQNCMRLTRQISHDISPPFVEYYDLNELIEHWLTELPDFLQCETHYRMAPTSIDTTIKLPVIRILQELSHNTIKHGKASWFSVMLRVNQKGIALKVADNGCGFRPKHTPGMGLRNIHLRTQLLKGKNKFKSDPVNGTRFILYLPLTDQ